MAGRSAVRSAAPRLGALAVGHRGQQIRELVAAEARDGVRLPELRRDAPRQFLKRRVTGAVPESVVDRLQAVHAEHEDRQTPLRAIRAGDGVAEPVHESARLAGP